MRNVTFISLPDRRKNRREYLRWLRLIRREVSWKTTKYTRICSRHFAQGETVPTLFPYNNYKTCTKVIIIMPMLYVVLSIMTPPPPQHQTVKAPFVGFKSMLHNSYYNKT